MPAMKWSDVVERCREVEISQAEMARRAGIAESTVVKGLARGSRLRGVTRAAVLKVLDEAQGEAA